MPASVVTFYSFKGGVGRTQTLANMAVGLANRGRNVVAVDMDLESPGLHTYFYPPGAKAPLSDSDIGARDGLLEHLERCRAVPADVPKIDDLLVDVTHPSRRAGAGWIRLLPAGRLTEDYPERVARFSWERFYEESHGSQYMDLLRDQLLATGADFVLLDSRAGMTDVATICTFQLPDVVVILFALHQQGLDGAARVAQAIKRSREEEDGALRPQRVLLVPARVDEQGELGLRDEWLLRVRLRMSGLGELLVEQGQHIPYLPRLAYGEQIVIDPVEPNPLSAANEHLLDKLDVQVGGAAPPGEQG
ncbi:MAG TPA: AAA family ATPase [Candidatus Nanopelagicales bacterium]|nr:AAA family ATPase [Candidatus Nanopelagicales bacterium]